MTLPVAEYVQVVAYETVPVGEHDSAALWVGEDGHATRHSLHPGTTLTYGLGARRCAGVRDGPHHTPCSHPDAPYCDRHTARWACARCTGDCDRPLSSCHEEHVIYLAAFAPDIIKVGVTRSWRLRTRLREQGANRAAHIETVSDGKLARQREAEIATTLPDRVRVSAKVSGLHLPVDESRWSETLSEFEPLAEFEFEYGFTLAERPIAETLASGTVIGVQGRILVIEQAGTTYAVNLRDLVGYELTETDDRALQSSLSAFE